tara:strand:+ start:3387 stop:5318 length:1932 start_codon:yes stop_codon:yes gene_type:complete
MVVGKPDFELNSFGIQYKEKKVNYTNKKNITVTTEAEDNRENTKWSKMNTPLEIQSNNSKKRGEPAPKPNAVQAAGSAPRPSPETVPKQNYRRGYQPPKDETQQATSSPPVEPHEDTSSSVDKIPIPQKGAGKIVELHGGKGTGTSQAQGKGLSTMVTQEGGSTHVGMEPKVPSSGKKGKGSSLERGKILEAKKNPITPKGYKQPSKKETKDIKTGKDPKGLRGEKGSKYTSQRLASIKSNSIITKMNIMKLDLMNKKDDWDKEEKVNNKKRVNHKDTWSVKPEELSYDSKEVEDPPMSVRVADDEVYSGKDRKTGKITDEKKVIPRPRVGEHPSSKQGFIPSGLGLNNRDTKYTHAGVTGNKKLSDKDRNYNMTPAMMTESYESAKLHKAADETIFKAISLKLDLMEIKKRKDMGDTAKDPDTEGLSHKEVSTNEVTGQKTVRPTHVQGGGYAGKGRRRKINGEKVIVAQTADETVPKQGQVPTSTKGDKHMSRGLNNASTGEIKESFDMITNNEAYQEAIHRNAPLTQEEGTEKFDNADATTNKIRARIAAREARKRGKGKKVNRAISEINSMTDGMRELIKETEVQRIKKIPANTEEEEQQKRFALSDAQRSDRMAKPDTSLLHNNKPYVPFSDRKNKDL